MVYRTSDDNVERIETLLRLLYMGYLRGKCRTEIKKGKNPYFKWTGDIVALVYNMIEKKEPLSEKYRIPKEHFKWDKDNKILTLPSIEMIREKVTDF